MCEFDPMHCDCHEWANPNAPRKSDMDEARRRLASQPSAPQALDVAAIAREWQEQAEVIEQAVFDPKSKADAQRREVRQKIAAETLRQCARDLLSCLPSEEERP